MKHRTARSAPSKPCTRNIAYRPQEWRLKRDWLFDRAKYLMMLKRYSYESVKANDYALLNELCTINYIYPDIHDDAWEDFFNDGFIME